MQLPPPPPVLLVSQNQFCQSHETSKCKRFYWKLESITTEFHSLALHAAPVAVSAELQEHLDILFSYSKLPSSSSAVRFKNKPLGLSNDIRLIQIQRLTSWKHVALDDVFSDVLACGSYWENQVEFFLALKFDATGSDASYCATDAKEADSLKFLRRLETMTGYFSDRCKQTLLLKETVEQVHILTDLLASLRLVNDYFEANRDALRHLLGIVMGITMHLNGVERFSETTVFCLSNLLKLKSFKCCNRTIDPESSVFESGSPKEAFSSASLLDCLAYETSENHYLNTFLAGISSFKLPNIKEMSDLYKQVVANKRSLSSIAEKLHTWAYIDGDRFGSFFCQKYEKIAVQFNFSNDCFRKEILRYAKFANEYEHGIVLPNSINEECFLSEPDFAKSAGENHNWADFNSQEIDFYALLSRFLRDYFDLQQNKRYSKLIRYHVQSGANKTAKSSHMISTSPKSKHISDITTENMNRLRETTLHKPRLHAKIDSEYGIDKAVLTLLKSTRLLQC